MISPLLADKRDWRNIRGKWPLARNPDKKEQVAPRQYLKAFLTSPHGSMDNMIDCQGELSLTLIVTKLFAILCAPVQ